MALYEFEGKRPVIAKGSYIHPGATVIGDVHIGEKCFIGAGAVLRADYGSVHLGNGSNIQENCVVHAQPDSTAQIGENVDVGHGAIIHGPCIIHNNVTVGMGSIICTDTDLGEHSFLGAGSLLAPGKAIPAGKIAMGNPAKVSRDIDEYWKTYSQIAIELYQGLPERYSKTLKLIEE